MATRCLFAADLDLATGKQVCPCVQTPGQSPRGSLRVPRGRCYTPYFTLFLYCVVCCKHNKTIQNAAASFASFFHFRKFCFLLYTQQQPNWKITPGCNAYTTLCVTRNDTRKITCNFFLSLPSALLILHFCIHKHLFKRSYYFTTKLAPSSQNNHLGAQ